MSLETAVGRTPLVLLVDPIVASDAARLRDAWDSLAAAKSTVAALYARWEELEGKR